MASRVLNSHLPLAARQQRGREKDAKLFPPGTARSIVKRPMGNGIYEAHSIVAMVAFDLAIVPATLARPPPPQPVACPPLRCMGMMSTDWPALR